MAESKADRCTMHMVNCLFIGQNYGTSRPNRRYSQMNELKNDFVRLFEHSNLFQLEFNRNLSTYDRMENDGMENQFTVARDVQLCQPN